MKISRRSYLFFFIAILSCATPQVSAEDSRDIALVAKEPNFLPSFSVQPAFTNTHTTLGFITGTGNYDATLSGNPEELKLAAFSPSVEGQVALISKLALNFFVSGNFTAGINAPAALLYGASVLYSISAGLLYSPIETDQSTFAIGLQINRPHLFAVSPAVSAAEKYNNFVTAGTPNFSNQNVTTQWTPSLRYAYAFTPWIGLQTELGFRIASLEKSVNTENTTQTSMTFALSVGTNMNTLIHIPIGLSASYFRGQVISSGQANNSIFNFGIYETNWPNVNFGGEFGIATVSGITTYLGAFQTRIYYN
jgi:hypothetical protein